MRLLLFIVWISVWSSPSFALDLYWNEKGCIEKEASKATNTLAARTIIKACRDLYAPVLTRQEEINAYLLDNSNSCFEDGETSRKCHQYKTISTLLLNPDSEYENRNEIAHEIGEGNEQFISSVSKSSPQRWRAFWNKYASTIVDKKTPAKCILGLDGLAEAKTMVAVRAILKSANCNQ